MLSRSAEYWLIVSTSISVLLLGAFMIARIGWRHMLRPFQPQEILSPPIWSLFTFVFFWMPPLLVIQHWYGDGKYTSAERVEQLTAASALVFPIQLFVVSFVMWVSRRHGQPAAWPLTTNFTRDVALGFVTWLLFFPPTQAVFLIVKKIYAETSGLEFRSQHSFIESLMSHPENGRLWFLIGVESIIGAPIKEELFFRGGLQVWLMRLRNGGQIGLIIAALGGVLLRGETTSPLQAIEPAIFVFVTGWLLFLIRPILVRWRKRAGRWGETFFPARDGFGQQEYQAVVGSALVFAMSHSASWPDPIPLTVLGLGLGWLAWRTQSLLGPIVGHSLFNAMTIVQLRLIALSSE